MAPDPDRHGIEPQEVGPVAEAAHKHQESFPQLSYPPFREVNPKDGNHWLKGKRATDGAEGLWRVHDNLYDLKQFIDKHPGGPMWLDLTKGTDITEQFETHHLHGVADATLAKYFVRKAKTPRHSQFTFHEHGFYKTLKAKVAEKVKEIPKDIRKKSDLVADALVLALLVTSPFACFIWSWNLYTFLFGAAMILFTGLVLCSLTICAHNYFHRTDNWRMYLFNVCGMSFAEWRVGHAMSHHLHTNTSNDVELSVLEPFLQYLPYKDKPLFSQMATFYFPVIYPFCTITHFAQEVYRNVTKFDGKDFTWDSLIPYILPIWMCLASGTSIIQTIPVWFVTLMVSSFFFMVFGITAGHHGHTNFFEGDIPRSENIDWGLHQLDTIVERVEYVGNHFKALTRFGDHALHHLFPTLDHAELKFLYPTLLEHCEKFETELRTNTFYQAVIGQAKQLNRKLPNNFREKVKAF